MLSSLIACERQFREDKKMGLKAERREKGTNNERPVFLCRFIFVI